MTEASDITEFGEWEPVSLCMDCARDPALGRLVSSDLVVGQCGVCAREEIEVFNLARKNELAGLIKALVRFHYDEFAYNPHQGGDGLHSLLLNVENPILNLAPSDIIHDSFVGLVEDEAYPERDAGIGLYAGHDNDGTRLMQWSITSEFPEPLPLLRDRLAVENFYAVEPAMAELVERLEPDLIAHIEADAVWFRARRGVATRYRIDDNGWTSKLVYHPYTGAQIGALPPPLASAGRMNRQGVSVLYVAKNPETAIREIRPHPGDRISIGGFQSQRRLRIADFGQPIENFATTDVRLDLFAIIYHLDLMMRTPVVPEERHRYLLTQLLAEVLAKRGFDGVSFRSSLGEGRNLCVFNPADFRFAPGYSSVEEVRKVVFDTAVLPSTTAPSEHHRAVG